LEARVIPGTLRRLSEAVVYPLSSISLRVITVTEAAVSSTGVGVRVAVTTMGLNSTGAASVGAAFSFPASAAVILRVVAIIIAATGTTRRAEALRQGVEVFI